MDSHTYTVRPFSRVIALILVMALALTLTVGALPTAFASQAAYERVAQLQGEQAELQQKQENYELELKKLRKEHNSAVKEYQLLDKQNQAIANRIDTTKQLLAEYDAQLADTKVELERAEKLRDEQYEHYCARAVAMEKGGTLSVWDAIFSSKSLTELLTAVHDMRKLLEYDSETKTKLEELEAQVAEKKTQLETKQAEQNEVLVKLQREQAELEQNEQQATATMQEIQQSIDEYEGELKSIKVECKELEADILVAETEAARKAAEEKAAAEQAAREKAEREQAERKQAKAQQTATQSTSKAASSTQKTSTKKTTAVSEATQPSQQETQPVETKTEQIVESKPVVEQNVVVESVEPVEEVETVIEAPPLESSSTTGAEVVQFAVQFVGNPYVWGGESLTEGCDCSGFIKAVYAHFGYSLPHFSGSLRSCGTGVKYSEAKQGDIICYDGHVGIYMGNGQMVNAFDSKHGIIICSVNTSRLVAVRRIL